ncbi:MAG: xanthine dehydrogenase family protein molybdopterin-binding subunit [Candidatus Rokubacteria bacterium]|nr:xanthine dehydrogenase family protein molybdopterin-binding subunit [Candidatus Rokubacteria bacterium]MBI3827060.1 xanthine dehydrogenase family protein molybdopterin-binding subunit [Candidatus Rokubacteria bacterium]
MSPESTRERWIGRPVKRVEDHRLLTGRGTYIDDHPPVANVHAAAIVRSPHAHARILGYDVSAALAMPGVVGVITGADVAASTKPFGVGVTAPVHYYCAATDKARFVGEPVAVVVAKNRYLAEDAAEAVVVHYEPLPAVVDPERALEPDAPVLHETVGTNLAGNRRLVYGDPDRAFAEAEVVIRERFRFPKYASTPIETYGVIARWDGLDGVLTVWSNFMGPFIMHPLVARVLGLPENRLRFIVPPDIGGSFGIKSSIYPYMALIGLAAMKTGVAVKWIEDRREHLLASSSGTDRVAYRELAARRDGTILGMRYRWIDNVGGYIRSPEPGCSFRPTGNFVGPYAFQHLEVDASVVMTNKSLTGPNRGYACGHLYFETEGMIDRLAATLGMDPVAVRRKNLIPATAFPYRTPTGGLYDSGDYEATLDRALEHADYAGLRRRQVEARAAGRWFGIGVALAVDPSVSNMGYVATALDPQFRAKPEYLPKSGAMDAATVKVDPLGRVTAIMATTPQGQGHQTVVSQIIADELGLRPEDVTVVDEMDTFTRVWSISSGTYSSRFGSVGAGAAALAARKLRAKLVDYAAHLMEVPVEQVEFRDGTARMKGGQGPSYTVKDLAGRAHWNATSMPEGMEQGLQATAVFGFSVAGAVDAQDRVNSSNTYGFIAEVMAVEIDRATAAVTIDKYVTVHDAGTIINPMIAEGQIYGGALHGLGGAMFEELAYDDDGQLLTGTFMDYLVPTASEAPTIDIAHVVSPSPLTPLGSKGLGESSSMTVPAVLANAVSDALAPLGVRITQLPITPSRLWHLIEDAKT